MTNEYQVMKRLSELIIVIFCFFAGVLSARAAVPMDERLNAPGWPDTDTLGGIGEISYYSFYDLITIGHYPNVSEDTLFCTLKGGDSVAIVGIERYNGWSQPNIPDTTYIPSYVKNSETNIVYRVTNISGNAYNGVPITHITLPKTLKSIENSAFYGSSLTSITIPDSVYYISRLNPPFQYCAWLDSINVSPANATFRSLDGVLFDKAMDTLYAFPGGRVGNYAIPQSVKYIGRRAFIGCGLIDTIDCDIPVPPTLETNAFHAMTMTTVLRVPFASLNAYKAISGYASAFADIISFSNVSDITETSAKLYWRPDTAVTQYKIDVYQNTTHIAHYEVDGKGQILSSQRFAPSIYHQKMDTTTSSTDYFVISLGGLSAGTDYNYTIDGTNAQNMSVYHEEGSFTTQSEPVPGLGITETPDDPRCARKILRNGHVFIIIGNETYTLQGQKIKDR